MLVGRVHRQCLCSERGNRPQPPQGGGIEPIGLPNGNKNDNDNTNDSNGDDDGGSREDDDRLPLFLLGNAIKSCRKSINKTVTGHKLHTNNMLYSTLLGNGERWF
jgi:hypothetical protein